MLSALGHCEDPACLQSSSSHELVRLFRCSIHCDRNVCLFHLNAHNVYYEEERKQNDIVISELQNTLSLYQTIFEQQIQSYRELVRQASSILLHNTSALVPIEQIRPVVEKLQQAISAFQEEKIIIKCEPTLDMSEIENKDVSKNNNSSESGQRVVLRIQRLDGNKIEQRESEGSTGPAEENPVGKIIDERQEQRTASPAYTARKTIDGMKKKGVSVKRLQK